MSSPSIDSGGPATNAFDVHRVMGKACEQALHSWEYGTAAEALLQLHNPELSVFSHEPFPGDNLPSPEVSKTPGLVYAEKFIRIGCNTLIDANGAAGDPASLGSCCLLIGKTQQIYSVAAKNQVDFILEEVPRWINGAISHRESVAALWADSVAMIPPFLAYYSVAIKDETLLREAYHQCQLYAEILRPQKNSSLWQHIVGPEAQDLGLWSTGNGWVAAGMTRVLAIMKKWGQSRGWSAEQDWLKKSIFSLLNGVMESGKPPLLRNYLEHEPSFEETAGTALLGAATYRVAVLFPDEIDGTHIAFAAACWAAIVAHYDEETGTVGPTVNPLDWKSLEPCQEGSSEGHSFAVMLWTARRDYLAWCAENIAHDGELPIL